MNLAAIETATAATAVAVGDGRAVAEVVADRESRHAEVLAPALAALLAERSLTARDLDVVVVDVGPGRFTGLRVGVATAKGLAVAAGVGLLAIESTDVLAASARAAEVEGDVVAVVDVRRGEVAWARYREGDDTPVAAPSLSAPDALARALGAARVRVVAVGDGAARFRDALGPVAVVREDLVVPSPAAAIALAVRRLGSGVVPETHASLRVRYVREADAVANFPLRGAVP